MKPLKNRQLMMTTESSPHSRAGQREESLRRRQLLPSVPSRAVKQLHVPKPSGILCKTCFWHKKTVSEPKNNIINTSEVTKLEFTFKRLKLKSSSLTLFKILHSYFSFSIPQGKMAFSLKRSIDAIAKWETS